MFTERKGGVMKGMFGKMMRLLVRKGAEAKT